MTATSTAGFAGAIFIAAAVVTIAASGKARSPRGRNCLDALVLALVYATTVGALVALLATRAVAESGQNVLPRARTVRYRDSRRSDE
ncbi:MAG: hypothetical protein GEV04_02395 [Actinophytocola sp.]|nr:hypothetical protein [Actinophytocola sp.]